MKRIQSDIKSGTFSRVYLLTGPEGYLRLYYTKKLADAVLPESDTMNRTVISGDKIDENEIIGLCDTLPFFAERRLVLVKDSGFFKNTTDRLPDYVKNLPEETVLIFSERECDKRNRLYKAVKSAGCVAEFPVQTEAALLPWGAKLLANANLRITKNDLSYLIARVGTDMSLLSLSSTSSRITARAARRSPARTSRRCAQSSLTTIFSRCSRRSQGAIRKRRSTSMRTSWPKRSPRCGSS